MGHPNTESTRRAVLVSSYRWTIEEGMRTMNSAEPVRRPQAPPARDTAPRWRRGRCRARRSTRHDRAPRCPHRDAGGLRNTERRRLRGRAFARVGFSHTNGKGDKSRWVPVPAALEPVAAEIRSNVGDDEYGLPSPRTHLSGQPPRIVRCVGPGRAVLVPDALARRRQRREARWRRGSRHPADASPCRRRRRRQAGGALLRAVLMGHSDRSTTQRYYTSEPTLQELADAARGIDFASPS
jgi:hypothetical protein